MTTLNAGVLQTSPATPLSWFQPGVPLLLGSCGLVVAAAAVGWAPASELYAGAPGGLWFIAAAQLAAWATTRFNNPSTPRQHDLSTSELKLALGRAAAPLTTAARAAAQVLGVSPSESESLARSVIDTLDRWNWPTAPVRIGLRLDSDQRTALAGAPLPCSFPVDFITVPPGRGDAEDLQRHRLDALIVAHSEQGLRVITREHPDAPAARPDWTTPGALSYARVFPVRLDSSALTIHRVDLTSSAECSLVGMLAVTTAALSRTSPRITLADRLVGRAGDDLPDACIACLGAQLGTMERSLHTPDAARLAARLVSAWSATPNRDVEPTLAAIAADAALDRADDEAHVVLRALAAHAAAGDDAGAFALMSRVRDALHAAPAPDPDADMLFVQGELEQAGSDPSAIGRLVAGLCLVAGSLPADRAQHVIGDFLDDILHADWLVGRDQDRALILGATRLMLSPGHAQPIENHEDVVAPQPPVAGRLCMDDAGALIDAPAQTPSAGAPSRPRAKSRQGKRRRDAA